METVWIDRKDGEREGRIAADCLNFFFFFFEKEREEETKQE